MVLDPWSHSATLDGALLNGLLHAGHTPEDPGDEKADAGKEAARAGHWAAAAECYQKAAEQGSSAGLSLLGECLYQGRGVPKSAVQARKLWKAAAESGEPIALLNLGDDCAARGDNGKALLCTAGRGRTRQRAGYRVYAPGLPAAGAVRDPLHLPQKGAGAGSRGKAGLYHFAAGARAGRRPLVTGGRAAALCADPRAAHGSGSI